MKLLFLDPSIIKNMCGDVKLCVCPPSEIRTAFCRDREYENFIALYCSYLYDDRAKEYRIYYYVKDKENKPFVGLAVSKDGLNFTKPSLGVFEYNGSTDNNLLSIRGGDGNVFIDQNAPDSERYKYVVHFYGKGLFLFVSHDGIHWDTEGKLIAPLMLDGCNMALYDDKEKCYRYYIRGWGNKGRISLWHESENMEPFDLKEPLPTRGVEGEQPYAATSHFGLALECDNIDRRDTDVYTLPVAKYPGEDYFIAFPSFYRHRDKALGLENDGWVEAMFVASRDGRSWERFDRTPYIRNEIVGERFNCMSYFGTGVHRIGNMIYSCGYRYNTRHGEVERRKNEGDGVMELYGQRLDGYVCASFGEQSGSVEVECVVGSELSLNVDTGAVGTLKMTCTCGQEVFNANICDNSLSHVVKLPESFCGKNVKLTFEGVCARLFAIETNA